MIFDEREVSTEAVIARGESLAAEILAMAAALGDLTDRLVTAHESRRADGGDSERDE